MPESLPSPVFCAQAAQVAELLNPMGTAQCLLMLCLLAEGEYAVREIEARAGIRQPSLSQHLGALRQTGIGQGRREAKAVVYHLVDARAAALLDALQEIFAPGRSRPPRQGAQSLPVRARFCATGVATFARLRPIGGAG